MRVGDIEIDSRTGILAGRVSVPTSAAGFADSVSDPVRALASSRAAADAVATAGTPKAWRALGGALVVGSLVLAGAALAIPGVLVTIVLAAGAIVLGAMGIAGFVFSRVRSRQVGHEASTAKLLSKQREVRVMGLLAFDAPPQTFEALRDQLGWSDQVLAPQLARLVEEGVVIEDMDPGTGQWTYSRSPTLLLPSAADEVPLTASERAARTKDDQTMA